MLQSLENSAQDIDALMVINTGASEIQRVFKDEDLPAILGAYMGGLKAVFAFALASSALTVLTSLVIPIKRLPDHGSVTGEKTLTT
jgi:MFS transporter, DHA2 family, glioxin efflux transporter